MTVQVFTRYRALRGERSYGEKKLLTKEAVDEKKLWTKRSCGRKKKLMILCLSAPVFQHPLLQSFTEQ
jgi:hypothetical protein